MRTVDQQIALEGLLKESIASARRDIVPTLTQMDMGCASLLQGQRRSQNNIATSTPEVLAKSWAAIQIVEQLNALEGLWTESAFASQGIVLTMGGASPRHNATLGRRELALMRRNAARTMATLSV
jgi:hypothetical protein